MYSNVTSECRKDVKLERGQKLSPETHTHRVPRGMLVCMASVELNVPPVRSRIHRHFGPQRVDGCIQMRPQKYSALWFINKCKIMHIYYVLS